jgi:spore coat polysaccharide biosynthesis protein SpsF
LNKELAIILTARMNSDRLPGKAMADVSGRPLLCWIARRLSAIGNVIIQTTGEASDDPIAGLASSMDLPCYRETPEGHAKRDVVSGMNEALLKFQPNAKWVLRGLGDCPFLNGPFVQLAIDKMYTNKGDAFAWALSPQTWPVYGSREFPYSRKGWDLIVQNSTTREHPDVYFHQNRDKFKVIMHTAPPSIYFMDYRLEVDWPEDMKLIRELSLHMSLLAPVEKVIHFLDANSWLASANRMRRELTGPSAYSYEEKRAWQKSMHNQPVVDWDGYIWRPHGKDTQPIFCKNGIHLMGMAESGILFSKAGRIKGRAYLDCPCGVGGGLVWQG